MSLRRKRRGRGDAPAGGGGYPEPAAYNIIPIQDVVMHGSHPSLRFPEVRAAVEALAHASDLSPPPLARDWDGLRADLFDWLGATFGFQLHNVRKSTSCSSSPTRSSAPAGRRRSPPTTPPTCRRQVRGRGHHRLRGGPRFEAHGVDRVREERPVAWYRHAIRCR
jgi:hypothetical protein